MTRDIQIIVARAILTGVATITCGAIGVKRSSLHRIAGAAGMPRSVPFAGPVTYTVTPESIAWAKSIVEVCSAKAEAIRVKEDIRARRRQSQNEGHQREKLYRMNPMPIRQPTAAAIRAACVAVSAMVAEGVGEIDPVTHKLDKLALAYAAKQHGLVLVDVLACRWAPRRRA